MKLFNKITLITLIITDIVLGMTCILAIISKLMGY